MSRKSTKKGFSIEVFDGWRGVKEK